MLEEGDGVGVRILLGMNVDVEELTQEYTTKNEKFAVNIKLINTK